MKSFSKVIGLILLILILLLAILTFAATKLLDPNDYKDEIRQLVRNNAALELHLNGEINWSLFPWLGLEVADVQVARLATPEKPFADVRLLALSVRVLPLLRKEIQMSDIRVDGLNLELHRDAQGNSNWEPASTTESVTVSNDKPTPAPTEENGGSTASDIKLDIDSIIVNSARLDYQDIQAGQHLTLENMQITTGPVSLGQDIPFKLSGFLGNAAPLIRARLEMSAIANLDLERQIYQLKELKAAGEFAGDPLNDKSANFSVRSNLLLNMEQQTATVEQLRLTLNQLKALADLQFAQLDTTPQIQGQLSIAQLNLKEFLAGIGITLPATHNHQALSRFALSSTVSGNIEAISLKQIDLTLDQTRLTGTAGSHDLAKGNVFAVLAGDKINIDDYLSPRTATQATPAATGSGSPNSPLPANPDENPWSTEELLPLADLRSLNLDAKLDFQELIIAEMPLHNLHLQVKAKQGLLELPKLTANLYDGHVNAAASLNAKADTARIHLKGAASSLPIERLLAAMQQPAYFEGKAALNFDLSSSGNSERALVNNLNGNSDFTINSGRLTMFNLDQYLCSAIATLNRKPLTSNFSGNSTNFNALSGSIQINQGQLNNSDLKISMPSLNLKGRGNVNLNRMGMDYVLGATLLGDSREMPDPACSINERYVGLELPLRCRGPVTGPRCQLDQDGLTRIATQLAGSKLTEKLDEKLGEKVSPELKDALKGLFR